MKYLSIICIAAVTLVSCGGELDGCGCIEKATEMVKSAESLEELEGVLSKLEEEHPECSTADDSGLDEDCPDAVKELESVSMAKGMELFGDAMEDLGDAMDDIDLDEE